MNTEHGFYIGKRGALYQRRESGSLSRFGIRITEHGIQVFDQLTRQWKELPTHIPDRSGGTITIAVAKEG